MNTIQKFLGITVGVGLLIFGAYAIYSSGAWKTDSVLNTDTSKNPTKTDLLDGIPNALSWIVSVDKNLVSVKDSYLLDYGVQGEQSTIIFESSQTMKANYSQYESLLVKEGWLILNARESLGVGILYAAKGVDIIHITISSQEESLGARSEVGINLFKK